MFSRNPKPIATWHPLGRRMPLYRETALVAADRAAVYDALADPEKRIVWDPTITRVNVIRRDAAGPQQWRLTRDNGMTMQLSATMRKPPYAVSLIATFDEMSTQERDSEDSEDSEVKLEMSYAFVPVPDDGGTHVEVGLRLHGVDDDAIVMLTIRALSFFKMRQWARREAGLITAFLHVDEIAAIAAVDAAQIRTGS